MAYTERASVVKVREALEERGVEAELVELGETARSAREAAAALGRRVEQIVKSLVFRGKRSGRPLLVLAGGANRVDEAKVSELFGEELEKADADFVRGETGFSIGGVPPVIPGGQPPTILDEDLLEEDEVWAAAGHTHVVFGVHPKELLRMTGAKAARIK
ncbi:MAG: YbaK/EbsC family protein [Rubrobacteraceae bacterium]|uniref:YbaK/EbsC family protein n=1 Tax=Rubrobacter naiadicus TaxID=1392641 RepID=UPI00235E6F68|nr:YbaK/EbsC family protein [Rubrobacter naiadicus]MBX6762614.1 YbaK/EbsC family protein [Rubrobacteraceae bacterium]